MLYPSINQLITDKKSQCRYSLVIAVAKHAREISEESEERKERLEERAVSLSVKDFADGKAAFAEKRDAD